MKTDLIWLEIITGVPRSLTVPLSNHSAPSVPTRVSTIVIDDARPKDVRCKTCSSPTGLKCFINDQVYLTFKKSMPPTTQVTPWGPYRYRALKQSLWHVRTCWYGSGVGLSLLLSLLNTQEWTCCQISGIHVMQVLHYNYIVNSGILLGKERQPHCEFV